jgi:hypothetical protein
MIHVCHVFHSIMCHGYKNITLNRLTYNCESPFLNLPVACPVQHGSVGTIARRNLFPSEYMTIFFLITLISTTHTSVRYFNQIQTIWYVFNGSFLHTRKWLTRTQITFLRHTTSLITTWIQIAEKFTSAIEKTDYSVLEQKENCYCTQCHLWKSRDLG